MVLCSEKSSNFKVCCIFLEKDFDFDLNLVLKFSDVAESKKINIYQTEIYMNNSIFEKKLLLTYSCFMMSEFPTRRTRHTPFFYRNIVLV